MKVIQVVPRIDDEASGPSYSVPRLSEALGLLGADVHLHVLAPARGVPGAYQVHTHRCWGVLSRLGVSPPMRRALRREAESATVLHNHSLWMMPNLYPAWAARGRTCRLVTSPRGTLSPWALRRSGWRKRLLWWLGQGRAVRASHCFHATAESECRDIRAAGLRGPVAIVPNGIDIPPEAVRSPHPEQRRQLLFLGRLHPVKGVNVLLRAWRQVQNQSPGWDLRIVGGGDPGYRAQLQRLAEDLGALRVAFAGPAFGAEKVRYFREADLFVLPTHTENFGVAVAEALAHGVPAVVTRAAPWPGLETRDCGWWIDQGTDALADCLKAAMALPPEQLRARGRRGRHWMEQEFSWGRVGRMMLETYRWLAGGGAAPAWMRT